eukprot:22235-Eustigmatos_ZCMA.PRE.1
MSTSGASMIVLMRHHHIHAHAMHTHSPVLGPAETLRCRPNAAVAPVAMPRYRAVIVIKEATSFSS